MKIVTAVIATNQINKKNSVIADSAIEDGAKQINDGGGMPVLHSHDWTRLIGWTPRAWTERRGAVLELVAERHLPETQEEWTEIEVRYAKYWRELQEKRTRPYLEHLHSIEHSDAELASDLSCVYVTGNDIISRAIDISRRQVDNDGLLVLDKFIALGDGLIKEKPYLLVPHRCFRQSYSLRNRLNEEFFGALARAHRDHPKLKIGVRLDDDLVGIPESLEKYEELDYWWGPKYKKNPNEIEYGVTIHVPTQRDVEYGRLKQTEFWWYGKERRTFETEEVMEYPAKLRVAGQEWSGMRFIHSMFDPQTKRPCHLDGAVRLYNDQLFRMRKERTIAKFGKLAERVKLWRVEGDMDVETWFTFINTFFRNNFTVGEYFGFSWENVK